MDWKNWKVRAGVVVAIVLVLAGTFTAGRMSTPSRVVTEYRNVEIEKEVKVVDQKAIEIAVKQAQAEWKKNEKTKTSVRYIYKEGKVIEKIVYIEKEKQDTGKTGNTDSKVTDNSKTQVDAKTSASSTEKKEEKVASAAPRWRIGAGIGATWGEPLSLSGLGSFTYEAHGEVRFFGGLWAGVTLVPQLKYGGLTLSFQY